MGVLPRSYKLINIAGLSLVNRKRTEPKKMSGFAIPKETNGRKVRFQINNETISEIISLL